MKLKNRFVLKDICDMYVAISMDGSGQASDDTDSVIRLNETAKRIFELIQDGKEEDDIVAALKEDYEATDETLRSEVRKVIKILMDEDLIA